MCQKTTIVNCYFLFRNTITSSGPTAIIYMFKYKRGITVSYDKKLVQEIKLYKNRQPIFGASQCSEQYKLRICIHDATPENFVYRPFERRRPFVWKLVKLVAFARKAEVLFVIFKQLHHLRWLRGTPRSRQCCCFKYSRQR